MSMVVCPNCKYNNGKDIVFEIVPKNVLGSRKGFDELHYYRICSPIGKEREICPHCLDEGGYVIITDTVSMKLPSREKQKSKGKSRFIGVRYYGNDKQRQLKKRGQEKKRNEKGVASIYNNRLFPDNTGGFLLGDRSCEGIQQRSRKTGKTT